MRLLYLIIFCAVNISAIAQQKDQASCFEFSIGTVTPVFKVKYSEIIGKDSLQGVSIKSHPGISIGLLKNFDMANKFILRTGGVVSYSKCNFKYTFLRQAENIQFQILSADFPLHFIYSFYDDKKNNPDKTFPYILIGGKYSISAYNQNVQKIYFTPYNASIDIGFGGRWYARGKHLFATELKYSFGLIDMISKSNESIYNSAFSRLQRHAISFSFNFS